MISEKIACKVTYNTDDYLMLLSSLSPYIALDKQSQDALYEKLRGRIEEEFGGSIICSYLSAFQIARK